MTIDDEVPPSQVVFLNKWYIQVPLHLILLEILVACILRTIYAIVLINKYRHKREECYKPPILDDSYYAGAPDYAVNPMPPKEAKKKAKTAKTRTPAKKGTPAQKAKTAKKAKTPKARAK
ncbi:Lysine histidine transporter-like 4 [Aphelenchoides besseyi]|nr:Lysine histidine transporter-like 4 [Aphelenchoides besseyi]KAI6194917.1 Lysine histidine transporter-like 4 [Aphelenchoides besseyi]